MREPEFKVAAKLTIDASDWGEAIQVAEAEFECGLDPRSRYGESAAPEDLSAYPPNEMNPITWAMIVEQAGEESPIDRPQNFDDRNYARTSRISLEAMRDLKWDRPVRLGSIPAWPAAGKKNASPRQLSVYNVRRVFDGYTSQEAQTVILLNYILGQDYPLERPSHGGNRQARRFNQHVFELAASVECRHSARVKTHARSGRWNHPHFGTARFLAPSRRSRRRITPSRGSAA